MSPSSCMTAERVGKRLRRGQWCHICWQRPHPSSLNIGPHPHLRPGLSLALAPLPQPRAQELQSPDQGDCLSVQPGKSCTGHEKLGDTHLFLPSPQGNSSLCPACSISPYLSSPSLFSCSPLLCHAGSLILAEQEASQLDGDGPGHEVTGRW